MNYLVLPSLLVLQLLRPCTAVIAGDGSCGLTSSVPGATCATGFCCSQYGWCGSSTAHCGSGCQAAYGTCAGTTGTCQFGAWSAWTTACSATCGGTGRQSRTRTITGGTSCTGTTIEQRACNTQSCPGAVVSGDGSCGPTSSVPGASCPSGLCCSMYGWCGSSTAYCGTGCQAAYGSCAGTTGTCQFGEWSLWTTACSATCGGTGRQSRTRTITGGATCTGTTIEQRACNTQSCPGGTIVPAPTGTVLYSGTNIYGTWYYDIYPFNCAGLTSTPEVDGYPLCASFTPGPYQQTLRQVNSNNVIAINSALIGGNRAKFCGKKVIVTYNGAAVTPPDGGSFFVWDGCAACQGDTIIDFSLSGLRKVNADACNLGKVPGVTFQVVDEVVKPFVP